MDNLSFMFLVLESMEAHVHGPNPIYRKTVSIPEDTPQVKGYDFNQGVNYSELFKSYIHTGFQATNVGLAIEQINNMVSLFYLLGFYFNSTFALKVYFLIHFQSTDKETPRTMDKTQWRDPTSPNKVSLSHKLHHLSGLHL